MGHTVEIVLRKFDDLAHSIRYRQVRPSVEHCNVIKDLYLGRQILEQTFGVGTEAPERIRVTVHLDSD